MRVVREDDREHGAHPMDMKKKRGIGDDDFTLPDAEVDDLGDEDEELLGDDDLEDDDLEGDDEDDDADFDEYDEEEYDEDEDVDEDEEAK